MKTAKFVVTPLAGGDPVEFPAPTPAAFVAKRRLRRDEEYKQLMEDAAAGQADATTLVHLLDNAAHCVECARALRVVSVDAPAETTYGSVYGFTLSYDIELVFPGEGEAGDENPTGTTPARS